MKRVVAKFAAILAILAALAAAIGSAESEFWLGLWMLAFVYVAIPVMLLTIADLIRTARGRADDEQVFSTGVHVTAVFAFLVGYLVYKMAVWSEHPMVDRHAYLPIVFVALVYGFPTYFRFRSKVMESALEALKTEEVLQVPNSPGQDEKRGTQSSGS
jgi:hypothetical protein